MKQATAAALCQGSQLGRNNLRAKKKKRPAFVFGQTEIMYSRMFGFRLKNRFISMCFWLICEAGKMIKTWPNKKKTGLPKTYTVHFGVVAKALKVRTDCTLPQDLGPN